MNVLTSAVPMPRADDPVGSLREMYTYLFDLSEQIDYTLFQQGIQLGRASLPATEEQVKALTALTEQLNTTVTALSATVQGFDSRITNLTDTVQSFDSRITNLTDRVQTVDERLAQIELEWGMHYTEYEDVLSELSQMSEVLWDLERRVEDME